MRYKLISLILAGFMLSGCAHSRWEKEGATKNDFDRDNYECQSEAARLYPSQHLDNNAYQSNLGTIQKSSDLCLKARGWEFK